MEVTGAFPVSNAAANERGVRVCADSKLRTNSCAPAHRRLRAQPCRGDLLSFFQNLHISADLDPLRVSLGGVGGALTPSSRAWHLRGAASLRVSSGAFHVPVSGVNPRRLPGVVVDIKHSSVVVPGFLPARRQRQLRVLSALPAADPRHSVGTVSGAGAPCPASDPPRKKWPFSLHYREAAARANPQKTNFPSGRRRRNCPSGATSTFYALHARTNPAAARSRSSVLHVRLLHHTSFLHVHIRERICISARTHGCGSSSVQ